MKAVARGCKQSRSLEDQMKYIPLKELTTRKGENVKLNYASQIELIVGEAMDSQNGGQRQGFDRDTNKKALRILTRLDALNGDAVLALEDADHTFLLARVNQFIWPFADQVFEQFCEDIEKAPSEQHSTSGA